MNQYHSTFSNAGQLGTARAVLRKLRGYVGGEDADIEIEIELEAILDSCIATRRQGKENDMILRMKQKPKRRDYRLRCYTDVFSM